MLGVELIRATMCGRAVAERRRPLAQRLWAQVLSGPLVQADETTVQVLKEPGRAAQTDSYMWVLCGGGPPERAGYLYHYVPTRAGKVAAELLAGYRGCAQTDGYAGYDFLDRQPRVGRAGCWAYPRRKFDETKKAAASGGFTA